MFGRALVARSCIIRQAMRQASSEAFRTRTAPLAAVSRLPFQKRYGRVEIFGPLDPPKQLTFQQVEERVLKAIRAWDRFPADKEVLLKIDATFAHDLGFDSLDHVEIMMAIEDEFGFEIPLTDSDKLKTPKDVFKYICEREDVYE